MALINPDLSGIVDGAVGNASAWTTPFNTIINAINGNIDASNIATGSITNTQLNSGAGRVVGEVVEWLTATPPAGWLICDGSSLLRAGTYAALFAIIGTAFGTVDGTHFTLPDLRGKLALGVSASHALATTGGAETVNLQHQHTWGTTNGSGDLTSGDGQLVHTNNQAVVAAGQVFAQGDTLNKTFKTDNQLSTTQSVLNPFVAVNYIVKY